MLIEVTKDDIKNGIPENECECAIALAVSRAARYELPDNYMEPNIFAVVHDNEIQVYYQNPSNQEHDLELDIELVTSLRCIVPILISETVIFG